MKKKVLGLALIAMSLMGVNAIAQNPAAGNSATIENVKAKKGSKKEARRTVNPYEGLNLTEAQKSQLSQLDSKRKADRQQQAQVRKENKMRDDSTRREARKAAKKEYLEQVKAIVGPEQYVVFLENMYVNGGGRHGDKAFKKAHKGDRHGMARDKSKKGHDRKGAKNRADKVAASAQTSAGNA